MGDVGADGERFLDNKRMEGSIPQMLENAITFVRSMMTEWKSSVRVAYMGDWELTNWGKSNQTQETPCLQLPWKPWGKQKTVIQESQQYIRL